MLEVEGLNSGYGRLPVLFGINFSVNSGELVALIGPNGAGKSTLLKTVLGIIRPTAGSIIIDDARVMHEPPSARVARGIALSPEGRRIFANLSVQENLLAGAGKSDREQIQAAQARIIDLFPILGERLRQRAGSLSGGEQQMLAIGRALMSRPKVLLIDELSLGLAPLVVSRLYASLRELADEGLAVVVVDERANQMMGVADRTYVLEKGEIVYSGARGDERLESVASSALTSQLDRD